MRPQASRSRDKTWLLVALGAFGCGIPAMAVLRIGSAYAGLAILLIAGSAASAVLMVLQDRRGWNLGFAIAVCLEVVSVIVAGLMAQLAFFGVGLSVMAQNSGQAEAMVSTALIFATDALYCLALVITYMVIGITRLRRQRPLYHTV